MADLPLHDASIASRYRGILLDIDGVVRRGGAAIPGAGETVAALVAAGIGVAFVTNNSSATVVQVVEHLAAVGVEATPQQVVTSAMAAAVMIDVGTRCLIIGSDGLRDALAGRNVVQVTDPGDAEAVVVGFDRSFSWGALRDATTAVRAGARFIATNTDATFPAAEGIWPGNGAVVAAIATASGRQPEVAGKPHAPLLHAAAARAGRGPYLMVGDRHETDIVGAWELGWDTALVLTGVTSAVDVPHLSPAATYVLGSVTDLLQPPPASPAAPALDLVIRTAEPRDVEGIITLWDAAGMLSYTSAPEDDLRLVMDHQPDLQVVAEAGGRLAGVAVGTFDGRRGWLMRVAVDPAMRGRGAGRAMADEVEHRLRRAGAPQIDLLVFDDNAHAKRFWEGLGYRQTPPVALFIKPLRS